MTTKNITDIGVHLSRSTDKRGSINWRVGDTRFHIWVVFEPVITGTGMYGQPDLTIHCNKGEGRDSKHTERDGAAQANAPIINHVYDVVDEQGLYRAAVQEKYLEEYTARQEQEAEHDAHVVAGAAPDLLAALKQLKCQAKLAVTGEHLVPLVFTDYCSLCHLMPVERLTQEAIEKADAAIAKAEPEQTYSVYFYNTDGEAVRDTSYINRQAAEDHADSDRRVRPAQHAHVRKEDRYF